MVPCSVSRPNALTLLSACLEKPVATSTEAERAGRRYEDSFYERVVSCGEHHTPYYTMAAVLATTGEIVGECTHDSNGSGTLQDWQRQHMTKRCWCRTHHRQCDK